MYEGIEGESSLLFCSHMAKLSLGNLSRLVMGATTKPKNGSQRPVEVDHDGPEGREEQVAHGLAEAGERGPARVPHLRDEDAHTWK